MAHVTTHEIKNPWEALFNVAASRYHATAAEAIRYHLGEIRDLSRYTTPWSVADEWVRLRESNR